MKTIISNIIIDITITIYTEDNFYSLKNTIKRF